MRHSNYKSICIISFSLIFRDARVLRQIKYLSQYYSLTVIGYGEPPAGIKRWQSVKWIPLDSVGPYDSRITAQKLLNSLIMALGRLNPWFYRVWYWNKRQYRQALNHAIISHFDAFLANDWNALPVAAEAASKMNARLVFDAHEYAPLQFENRIYWKLLFRPAIMYFMKKYASFVDAAVTVAPMISERYKKEFGLDPLVILNSPENMSLPIRMPDFDHIRLVHHGGATRDRRLEKLIETLALCDRRFSLHLILVHNDFEYIRELKKLADELTSGRVIFHEPVLPEEIVATISQYDLGFCLISPTNYNYLISLPNKFFDYITAGLAICIGPSPAMAEMVQEHRIGWVAASFEPKEVAETLNRITAEELVSRRMATRETAKKINAATEMSKLIQVFDRLLLQVDKKP